MAKRRYDIVSNRYFESKPLAAVRAVEPLRRGAQGELRQHVRCLLLQAMGFACEEIPLNAKIPHQFPTDRFTPEQKYEFAFAAYDGLRELGYDAAADMLEEALKRPLDPQNAYIRDAYISIRAKDALVNLEAGPPSGMVDRRAIFTHTIKGYRDEYGNEYIVGRPVYDPRSWYRFFVGVPIYSRSGTREGWDPEGGFTFQRRGRTLADVLAPLYGSAKLELVSKAGAKSR